MLRRASTLCLIALVGIAGPAASAQDAPVCPSMDARTAWTAAIDRLVDSVKRANPAIPGVAIAIESPSRCLLYTAVAGVRDIVSQAPLQKGDVFRQASIMKTYVAAAILRLVEDGKLRLDDPIAKYLTEETSGALRAGSYDPTKITIRQLLTHTSGIFDHTTAPEYFERINKDPTHRWSRLEQVEFGSARGMPYGAPGELFHYSDTGYILLGEIIEMKTTDLLGPSVKRLARMTREEFPHTWQESVESPPAGVERAHQYQGEMDMYGVDASIDLYGGGGFVAPEHEVAHFYLRLLTGKVFKKPATLEMMLTLVVSPTQESYRAGIAQLEMDGTKGWGHSGYWNTFGGYFPSLDVAMAGSFTSTRPGAFHRAVARELVRIFATTR